MKTVRLYGALRKFGTEFLLDIQSPAEALVALSVMCPGFRKQIQDGVYRMWVGRSRAGPLEVVGPFSDREVIRISPAVAGADDSASIFEIIIGGLLIYFAGPIGAALAGIGINANIVATVGVSLVLAGVSQLLFKPPSLEQQDSPTNKPSYIFNGAVNTVAQGNPVPIGYGEMIVGSQVISLGLATQEIPV